MIRQTDPEPETTGPVDRDERLGEAIEAYLEQAEGGHPPDPEEFAAGYPDLGEDLVSALEGLALVRGLVGGPHGPGHRLEEGRRVAGYRIVRELGRGGMGIVYEAVHVGLDRPVALKVLGGQAAPDSSGRRRFLNEAKTAAGLHHTHIVPVFDVGQVGGLCYYAMQRIEGSGLDRVLRHLRRDRTVAAGSTLGSASPRPTAAGSGRTPSRRPAEASLGASGLGDETLSWGASGDQLPPWRKREAVDEPSAFLPPRGSAYYRWVADVGRQAATALGYAHQRGVIHRDIKPSNLLVDARGTIWVADFGLARRLADPSHTQVDSLLGTPRYMSPEQTRPGLIDGRADVYSLGATLYELITLRPPFDGRSAAELIEQIARTEPPRPRKFDPRVPLDLETILLKALAKRPDDRYESADELAEDLVRFLAHEPVRARRIGPVGRLMRFARRHPSLTAVSSTAAAVVLTTATVAYVRIVDERDRADEAAAAAKKAQGATEVVNQQLKVVNRQLRSTMLEGLEKHAANVRLSNVPNRRSTGLELLRQAAEMKPEPALQVRLRDQALDFLSIRDVAARPPIATPGKSQHGLVFSDDGKRMAALSDGGELGVWDVEGRELIDSTRLPISPSRGRQARGGNPQPRGPRIAAAGDRVAVIHPDGDGIRLFDLASPDAPPEVFPLAGHHVMGLAASADGHQILTIDRPSHSRPEHPRPPEFRPDPPEEPRLHLWDAMHPGDPPVMLTLPAAKGDAPFFEWQVWPMVAISPDGSKIAAARFSDARVSLWDGQGKPLPPIDVQGNVTALALGPAGLLAVAGTGGEIALWDLSPSQPKPLPGLGIRQSFIKMLRFSPRDGSMLAAAGMGSGIELWDLTTRSPIAGLLTRESVDDLAFSPDGRTLAAGQASSIALWSMVEPLGQSVLPELGDRPGSLAFGPGELLAITSMGPNFKPAALRFWGGPGVCPPSLKVWDQLQLSSVGFDAQGRLIAFEPAALRWFRPPAVEPVAEVEIPPASSDRPDDRRPGRPDRRGEQLPGQMKGRIVARTPDGRTLILGGPEGFLIRNGEGPEALSRFELPDRIEGAAFLAPAAALDPSGSILYYLGHRGEELTARSIRGTAAREVAWSLPVSNAAHLAMSPDGSTLAFAERKSGVVVLVDTARGLVRGRLEPPVDDSGTIESLQFSPDGSTLAVGSRDQIRLWSVGGESRPLVRLPGHRGPVHALAFDERGERLAGVDDKTVKVWDIPRLRAELETLGLGW
ncbi:WD40 repeat domain-containing serine/threonine protein kinase [Tundrisphaera lichenicola]|uniref:WD40 repeat domain-containing serine/threonine protein kinase n=1 Tax=Tundrisphaera lichenicola TaxID=2029860 RepID=UPI003EBB5434